MQYFIEEVFPTPIYVSMLENIQSIQTEIGNAVSNSSFNKSVSTWGKSVKVTDLLDDIIKKENMITFERTLDDHIKNYCNHINFSFREYTRTSWLARLDKDDHTHVHDHSFTDISGCYYYQTNEEDGNLFFLTPTPATSSLCFQKYAERWDYKPCVGKLLLFPSYLLHGVKTNITDSVRISLSFSIVFKR